MSRLPSLEHVPPLGRRPAWGHRWAGWVTAGLDLLFPPFCPTCQASLGDGRRDPLCGACWATLERIGPPVCEPCGAPLLPASGGGGLPGHTCGACRGRRPAFDYARAAARYEGVARKALHELKFGGRPALAAPLGDLMAEVGAGLVAVTEVDLLVPVPLHPRRRRERGFNQADLLARRVSRGWGTAVGSDALGRGVATRAQTELDADERRANVRGAFVVRRPELVAGRHVLLVDDVLTTGATAGECARTLRAAGALRVGVLTLARAL